MTRKQKQILLRVIFSAVFLIIALITENTGTHYIISSVFYLAAYFIIGYDIIIKAVSGLRHRRFIDENFLMSVASIGAVFLHEFGEGVAVMLLYQIGELFQKYAIGKSRESIAALMDIRPDTARVIRNGEALKVSPEEVEVGEIIEVNPGEKIPLDGIVIEGEAEINTCALTGESLPLEAHPHSEVLAGCIVCNGVIKIRVTKPFSESSVSKILALVENSSANKSKSEKFITKFARWYTPLVVVAALALAIIPQFFITAGRVEWIRRALIFLVISCPCALVISVPLSFFGGIGSASSKGILIKGSNCLETLTKCDTVVFDKTGTLTQGDFSVAGVFPEKISERVLVAVCAAAEQHSSHPVAKAVVKASGEDYKKFNVFNVKEIAGKGVIAIVEKWEVACGNSALMKELEIDCDAADDSRTVVHISIDGKYAGNILVSDSVKETAYTAVSRLREAETEEIIMLTGDRKSIAQNVSESLKLDRVYSELLPAQKVEVLEEIMTQTDGKVIFVGDGINDAPVITRADVGIAMGALGSDAAIEAADIVLTDDDPSKVATAIGIAKKTCNIATQNIAFALSVKALFLLLGAFGAAGMAGAIFADVGVAVIAVLNSMRCLKYKE